MHNCGLSVGHRGNKKIREALAPKWRIADPIHEPSVSRQWRNRELSTNTLEKMVKRQNASLFRRTADALPVKATEWILRYISNSRIETDNLLPNRRYTLSSLSFFVLHQRVIGGPRIPPVTRRCFADDPLND
ncbi:hypothetical protein HAX54_010299, partial [Datura stramonium]|nr:hypothetical protein [Datura stramonium]